MSSNLSLRNRPTSPSDFGSEDDEYWKELGLDPLTGTPEPPRTPQLGGYDPHFLDYTPIGSPKTPTNSPPKDILEDLPDIPRLTLSPARSEPPTATKKDTLTKKVSTPRSKPLPIKIPASKPAPISVNKPPVNPTPKKSSLASGSSNRKRTLKTLPDRASNTIQRVVNHKIRKERRRATRPRLTKDPNSSPYRCRICDKTCNGRFQYLQHLHGRDHRRAANPQVFKCQECNLTVSSQADLNRHLNGGAHRLQTRS